MCDQFSGLWRAVGDSVVLEPAVASMAFLPGLSSRSVGAGQAVLLNGTWFALLLPLVTLLREGPIDRMDWVD